ncbi:spore coat protein [Cytobacillus spongiae]|uniref:spore coat protein n=1 Tax=Cytobacillus spongiae TaxID=2901381 RepID=UPI0032C45EBE
MQPLTGKELEYIVDSMSNEDLLVKQCVSAGVQAQTPGAKDFCKELVGKHQQHYQTLLQLLQQHTSIAPTDLQQANQMQGNQQQHTGQMNTSAQMNNVNGGHGTSYQQMGIKDIQQAISQSTMGSQQSFNQTQIVSSSILKDEDLLYTILADLKRTSREYTTAATESNCSVVRNTFENLLQDSLKMQGQLYQFMSQQGMYNTSSPAVESQIAQQITQYSQTQQQTDQLVQQHLFS